jgi:hypothetical protein
LSKRSSTLAAFTFTRLPESSSICIELSASDITRPARNFPASSNRAYAARSVTLRAKPTAWAPSSRQRATAASTPGWRRSQTTTIAPSRANFSAVARPMPWAAPVMMETLSFKRMVCRWPFRPR